MSDHEELPQPRPSKKRINRFVTSGRGPEDVLSKPSSASPAANIKFLRRVQRLQSQQSIFRGDSMSRVSAGSLLSIWVVIPVTAFYFVFIADWGPREHVFSGPQRWYRRQVAKFWSLPGDQPSPTITNRSSVGVNDKDQR